MQHLFPDARAALSSAIRDLVRARLLPFGSFPAPAAAGAPASDRARHPSGSERRQQIARCRSLRSDIRVFEDTFERERGHKPHTHERQQMLHVYVEYRRLKQAVRGEAVTPPPPTSLVRLPRPPGGGPPPPPPPPPPAASTSSRLRRQRGHAHSSGVEGPAGAAALAGQADPRARGGTACRQRTRWRCWQLAPRGRGGHGCRRRGRLLRRRICGLPHRSGACRPTQRHQRADWRRRRGRWGSCRHVGVRRLRIQRRWWKWRRRRQQQQQQRRADGQADGAAERKVHAEGAPAGARHQIRRHARQAGECSRWGAGGGGEGDGQLVSMPC
jgi:hypothetical protein